MKKIVKSLSIVLVLTVLFSMFPETTFVMEKENVKAEEFSGMAGEDAIWTFDSITGTLTYSEGTCVDSYGCTDYAEDVKKIVFESPVEVVCCDEEGAAFINLEEVVIPETMTDFDVDIISHSAKLKTITVDENNEFYYTQDGNLYFSTNTEEDFNDTTLCKYIPTKKETSFVVPEGIYDISSNAFSEGTAFKELVLPESLQFLLLDDVLIVSSLQKVTFKNPEGVFFLFDESEAGGVVLCGYRNTYIELLAKEYGLEFQALPDRAVKSMTIKEYPNKMTYEAGRSFVPEGLILDVEYEDGGTAERTVGYEVTGFDSSEVGECEVTISMGGASVKFTVEIVELDISKVMQIGVDREITVKGYEDGKEFYFTPEMSGEYAFYTTGKYDTYCELYDVEENMLTSGDDTEDDLNFYVSYELEAGKTYILYVTTFEESVCTFKVKSKLLSSDDSHTEHNYIPYYTEAASGKDAYTEYICSGCGDKYVVYEHEYETTVIPATCTSKGFTLHKCKNCGEVYSDNEVPVLKHNYVATIIKPATTKEAGEKQYKCSLCGDSYRESIAKLPEETTSATDNPIVNKPGKVKKLKVKVSGRKAKMSWKKIKKVSGYEIKIGRGKKVKNAVKTFSKKNTLTYKKLKKKTYYFKVRAYRTVNGKKVYGKWSSVKKFVVKK